MKVKQLIAQLQELDPDLEVLCYTEDNDVLPPNHGFRLFDITEAKMADGTRTRGEDHIPSLKLGKGPHSQPHALIDITSDM